MGDNQVLLGSEFWKFDLCTFRSIFGMEQIEVYVSESLSFPRYRDL